MINAIKTVVVRIKNHKQTAFGELLRQMEHCVKKRTTFDKCGRRFVQANRVVKRTIHVGEQICRGRPKGDIPRSGHGYVQGVVNDTLLEGNHTFASLSCSATDRTA